MIDRVHLIQILLILSLMGCSHRYVLREDNISEFYSTMNDELNERKAMVTLIDDEEFPVYSVQANSEGENEFVTFVNLKTGDEDLLPVETIKTIRVKNRAAGGTQGFLIGLASGFIAGAVAGLIKGDDPPCDNGTECVRFTGGVYALIYGTLLGIAGGGTGSIIGAIKGSESIFYPGKAIVYQNEIDEEKVE